MSAAAIAHELASGRLVIVERGVFALPPVLEHDSWGRWMGATLTAPGTRLSQESAGTAWGFLSPRDGPVTVTRPGNGGPRRHGGLLVFRSSELEGEHAVLHGIPITTVPRTLLDIAPRMSERLLARSVREAVRMKLTTIDAIADCIGRHGGRRGARPLARGDSALHRPADRARTERS